MPQARKLALRALELDPDLPDAQAMLGTIATQYDYDWPEAERRFQRAMSHPSISSDVHRAYGFSYLLLGGRPAEAVAEVLQAVLEDPLFPVTRINYSMCLAAAGRLPEAIEEMVKLRSADSTFWPAHTMLSTMHWLQGNLEEALIHSEKAYRLAPWNLMSRAGFAGALAAVGQAEHGAELIAQLNPDTYGVPMALATYHVMRGDFAAAADSYAKGIEQRDPRALPTRYMLGPEFHSSAHWPRLAKMMSLPQTMTTRSF
jgi:Tfp pilus assembly protein PilF